MMVSHKNIISQGLPKLYTIHGGSSGKKKDPRASDLGSWRGREDLNLRGAFYTPYSLSRGAPSASWVLPHGRTLYSIRSLKKWRREWDSNPRMLSHRRFSRPVLSTAQPSLRVSTVATLKRRIYVTTSPRTLSTENLRKLL